MHSCHVVPTDHRKEGDANECKEIIERAIHNLMEERYRNKTSLEWYEKQRDLQRAEQEHIEATEELERVTESEQASEQSKCPISQEVCLFEMILLLPSSELYIRVAFGMGLPNNSWITPSILMAIETPETDASFTEQSQLADTLNSTTMQKRCRHLTSTDRTTTQCCISETTM